MKKTVKKIMSKSSFWKKWKSKPSKGRTRPQQFDHDMKELLAKMEKASLEYMHEWLEHRMVMHINEEVFDVLGTKKQKAVRKGRTVECVKIFEHIETELEMRKRRKEKKQKELEKKALHKNK